MIEIYGPDIVDKDEKFQVTVRYRRDYYDPLCPSELIITVYGYWNGGRSMNILFDKTYPMQEEGEIPITIGTNSYEWIDIWACEKYRRYTGVCSVFKQECTKKKVEVRLPPRPTPIPVKGSFSVSAPQSVKVGEHVPVTVTFRNPNSTEALFKATVTFAGVTEETAMEVPPRSSRSTTVKFTAPVTPGKYLATARTVMYVADRVFDLGRKAVEVEVTAPKQTVPVEVRAPGEEERPKFDVRYILIPVGIYVLYEVVKHGKGTG